MNFKVKIQRLTTSERLFYFLDQFILIRNKRFIYQLATDSDAGQFPDVGCLEMLAGFSSMHIPLSHLDQRVYLLWQVPYRFRHIDARRSLAKIGHEHINNNFSLHR